MTVSLYKKTMDVLLIFIDKPSEQQMLFMSQIPIPIPKKKVKPIVDWERREKRLKLLLFSFYEL